jgi:hypothetical protein
MKFDTKKEILKWQDRAIFDVRFKKDTKANLSRLDEIMLISMEHFVTIAANSEPLCYKICRYLIESGKVKNEEIEIIDGQVIASYIGDDSAEWKKKERIEDFFSIFAGEVRSKWVMIPILDFDISTGLAVFFMSQFKKSGAVGIIFYAEGPDNMVETLVKNVDDRYFYQFPNMRYKRARSKKLQDDEW